MELRREDHASLTPVLCYACGRKRHVAHLIQRVAILPGAGEDEFVPNGGTGELGDPFQLFTCCEECFDELVHALLETIRDDPPVLDDNAVRDCTVCGSSILHGETCFQVSYVRGVQMRRRGGGVVLDPVDSEEGVLCIACADLMVNQISELDEAERLPHIDTSNDGECDRCSMQRCWRHPICHCRCHGLDPGGLSAPFCRRDHEP